MHSIPRQIALMLIVFATLACGGVDGLVSLGGSAPIYYYEGLVWLDSNGNGMYEAESEFPESGVLVQLLFENDQVLDSDSTDENGRYAFESVHESVRVQFFAPSGYTFTIMDQGDDKLDSDVHPDGFLQGETGIVTDQMDPFNLSAGLIVSVPTETPAVEAEALATPTELDPYALNMVSDSVGDCVGLASGCPADIVRFSSYVDPQDGMVHVRIYMTPDAVFEQLDFSIEFDIDSDDSTGVSDEFSSGAEITILQSGIAQTATVTQYSPEGEYLSEQPLPNADFSTAVGTPPVPLPEDYKPFIDLAYALNAIPFPDDAPDTVSLRVLAFYYASAGSVPVHDQAGIGSLRVQYN